MNNTHRAVVAIKAGVVSLENVAFLKIVHPVVLDVLGEFLIRSVGRIRRFSENRSDLSSA